MIRNVLIIMCISTILYCCGKGKNSSGSTAPPPSDGGDTNPLHGVWWQTHEEPINGGAECKFTFERISSLNIPGATCDPSPDPVHTTFDITSENTGIFLHVDSSNSCVESGYEGGKILNYSYTSTTITAEGLSSYDYSISGDTTTFIDRSNPCVFEY